LAALALVKLGAFGLEAPVSSLREALAEDAASFRRRAKTGGNTARYVLYCLSPVFSGLTIFGVTGYGGVRQDWNSSLTLAIALVCGGGGAALLGVLVWSGNKSARGRRGGVHSAGRHAVVTQLVLAGHSGYGKIAMEEDGRTVERSAITSGEDLPVGTTVLVLEKVALDTYVVVALPQSDPTGPL
jgi:hypothetical protein